MSSSLVRITSVDFVRKSDVLAVTAPDKYAPISEIKMKHGVSVFVELAPQEVVDMLDGKIEPDLK